MSTIIITVSIFIALEKKIRKFEECRNEISCTRGHCVNEFLSLLITLVFLFFSESTGKPHISLMPFLNCMSIILHSKQMHCVLYEISYLVLLSLSLIKKHPQPENQLGNFLLNVEIQQIMSNLKTGEPYRCVTSLTLTVLV